MGRIIPWGLPEIYGGSIGGYTPVDPTPTPPEPVPEPEPEDAKYIDFDNAVMTFEIRTQKLKPSTKWFARCFFYGTIVGAVIVDKTPITSATFEISTAAGTFTYNSTTVSVDALEDSPITNYLIQQGGSAELTKELYRVDNLATEPSPVTTTVTVLKVSAVFYDANGDELQRTVLFEDEGE